MKAKEIEKPNVPWKFQLDIALVSAVAIFISVRLVKIGLIFVTSPGEPYTNAIFFFAYPLLAIAWGCLSRPLHYPLWATMSVGLLGFGAGLFFIGYFLFEVPSNLILHRVGARLWIAPVS
jgi:hypothetical protein